MTTYGTVMLILCALLGISLLVNIFSFGYAKKVEDYYLDWIEEINRERKW